MANNNMFTGRVAQKHDIEANWIKAINFIPMNGEIIVYDEENEYSPLPVDPDTGITLRQHYIAYKRIKIGDGVNKVSNLPFFDCGASTPICIITWEEND